MTIEEIINSGMEPAEIIAVLKEKSVTVPAWTGKRGLQNEYYPGRHPVMDKAKYPDIVTDDGIEEVTRITIDLQRLATKRMSELVCGIPVKRVYRPEDERQKEVAEYLENIFDRNRINSMNTARCSSLFASCEVMTLWYAVEQKNDLYGFSSGLKLRCKNFSPMDGYELYPLFDELDDMVAMSVAYTRKSGRKSVQYFDTYTAGRHIKWMKESGEWTVVEDEAITLGKIPAVYAWRSAPIWEDTSRTVYEKEWALSRNGNYLRKNGKPLFIVFADEQIGYGDEKDEKKEFRSVMQYPKGSSAQYVTWEQAIENLKFYVQELRSLFFNQLQLPDWSYEKMSQQALSGESRKQMFIDSQLKVMDESGPLVEFFDREVNVVKAFLKVMLGESYAVAIEALKVESVITPFTISDARDTISNLTLANGGEPIMSQRESIEMFGHSDDVDRTMREIEDQKKRDVFDMTE